MYLLQAHPEKPFGSGEFHYCAPLHIQRKTGATMGKTVILPPVSSSLVQLANRNFRRAERQQLL
jgi:hypothetical protein